MKLSLRTILTAAFMLVSVIPLGLWAAWVSTTALEQKVHEVEERHLLLAKNVSSALSRYSQDAKSVFELAVNTPISFRGRPALQELLGSMKFRHVCTVDADTGRISSIVAVGDNSVSILSLPTLIDMARARPEQIFFSPVMHNARSEPAIYALLNDGAGTIALAELGTEYIQSLQASIAFGEKGHAAIVDNEGNVLGHPRPDWVAEVKNIAKIDPVARMIAGETGVSKFFSPALGADMIAGFTAVPETGWGVMIPQPFSELEASAEQVRETAYWVVALGAAIAALLGWFLSGLVTGPLSRIVAAARGLASGEYDRRVDASDTLTAPSEIRGLSQDFNSMAAELQSMHERDLRTLRAAEEAVEAKSDFVARISHELRTPLNSVIGFSGMIRSETHGPIDQPEYKEYAGLINEAGDQLLRTINDILSFARADGKSGALQEEEIDLAQTIDFIVGQYCGRAIEGNVALTAELPEDLPNVRADELKIRQVLSHLTENAVRFTQAGGSITVSARHDAERGIEISVADSGIGMSEEQIPVALQPFGQIENRLTRRFDGTGLGLPLARMLIELHGGGFSLESTLGEGTTVRFTIPAERIIPKTSRPARLAAV